MGWYAKDRAVERIARAAGHGLDLVGFWNQARDALAPAIPHHLTPCWYTLDPASLLVTSHYDHGMIPELPSEWLAHEYREDDCHKLADIARAKAGLSTLHDATGGDPSSSPRFKRYVQPYGGEQELLVALRTRTGETWGVLALYRAPGQPQFSGEERELLLALAPTWLRAPAAACSSARQPNPSNPEPPAWSCSPRALSRTRSPPGSGSGLPSFLAATEERTRCLTPSSRSPAKRSAPPPHRRPARSHSRACSHAPGAGSCSTEPFCNPAAADESPSSSSQPIPRESHRC
jgi:hypothetical protein